MAKTDVNGDGKIDSKDNVAGGTGRLKNFMSKVKKKLVSSPEETKEMLQNSNIAGPGHVTAAVAGGDHSADAAAGAQRILGGAAKATGNTELGKDLQDSAEGIENVKSQTREQINADNSKIPTVEDLFDEDKEISSDSVKSSSNNSNSDRKDKNNNNRSYGIWSAYKNGEISKEGAIYYTIDAIANFLKDTGKRFGNIGAQYTGGTIDDSFEESQWNQRNRALNAEEAQNASEKMGGHASRQAEAERLSNVNKSLANASQSIRNSVLSKAKKMADSTSGPESLAWARIATSGQISDQDVLALGGLDMIRNFLGWK